MDIPREKWPICGVCNKPVEDFQHLTHVFEDEHGRIINSFVAFWPGDRQQAICVAGQTPPRKFSPAFSAKDQLTTLPGIGDAYAEKIIAADRTR